MSSSNGEPPENGEDRETFDDHAIRNELRKIVEREEVRLMEKFTATENDIRSQYDALQDVDKVAKRKFFSDFETGKGVLRTRFQMMLDYIERN